MNRRSSHEARVQPLRERVREATRDAILAAAEVVFARRGIGGARMEEIAEQAGVAVGTLYNYFDDRDALLAAVLQSSARELSSRLAGAPVSAGAPVADQLRGLLAVVFAHVEAHFDLFATIVEEELATGRVAAGPRRRPAVMRAVHERAAAIVEAGIARGELRGDDAHVLPWLLLGMMRGVLTWRLFAPDRPPLADAIEPLVRTFLHGTGRTP